MAGFFILILLVFLAQYWYVLAGVVGLWLLWFLVLGPVRRREIEQAKLRRHHEQARANIDAVARTTAQAMMDAAGRWRS